MLVLSRKEHQTIVIGEEIVLTVLRIQGNLVRIGIQAPGNLRILRGELIANTPPVAAEELQEPVGEAA